MTDKEFVISIDPKAKCVHYYAPIGHWQILGTGLVKFGVIPMLSQSFSPRTSWKMVATLLREEMLKKLES